MPAARHAPATGRFARSPRSRRRPCRAAAERALERQGEPRRRQHRRAHLEVDAHVHGLHGNGRRSRRGDRRLAGTVRPTSATVTMVGQRPRERWRSVPPIDRQEIPLVPASDCWTTVDAERPVYEISRAMGPSGCPGPVRHRAGSVAAMPSSGRTGWPTRWPTTTTAVRRWRHRPPNYPSCPSGPLFEAPSAPARFARTIGARSARRRSAAPPASLLADARTIGARSTLAGGPAAPGLGICVAVGNRHGR